MNVKSTAKVYLVFQIVSIIISYISLYILLKNYPDIIVSYMVQYTIMFLVSLGLSFLILKDITRDGSTKTWKIFVSAILTMSLIVIIASIILFYSNKKAVKYK